MLRERHALNPQQQEGLNREARQEKDGKHSSGIGEPKRTVLLNWFYQSQSKISGTIWQETSYNRSYGE